MSGKLAIQRLIRRVQRPAQGKPGRDLSYRALDELGREWERWLNENDISGMTFEEAWQRFSGRKLEG